MIVIPTYNEAENIGELIMRVRAAMPGEPLLFIDDNSPDGTANKIRGLAAHDPDIFLILRPRKLGLGSAYLHGFKEALARGSEYIVAMDADLSHDPADIPRLLAAIKPISASQAAPAGAVEADVAVGSRYIAGGKIEHWNWLRASISRFGNVYARVLTAARIPSGQPLCDLSSGFVAYRADALRALDFSKIRSEGYAFQIDIKSRLCRLGKRLVELPIIFHERPHGKSKFSAAIFLEGVFFPWKVFAQRISEMPRLAAKSIFKMNTTRAFAWLVFAASIAAYFATAPRTIFFGDNAEFVTAVKVLGVPHPSGYPLYVLLAKVFSWIAAVVPGLAHNYVLGVNIFSALCSSVSLVMLYYLGLYFLRKVQDFYEFDFGGPVASFAWRLANCAIAALGALFLAFSNEFWYQSVVAKTYTLNLVFLLALLWLLIKFWDGAAARKYFFWAAFLFGLGAANHQMLLLFGPALLLGFALAAYFEFRSRPDFAGKVSLKNIVFKIGLPALLLFVLGLGVYAYLPLRSAAHPLLDWGHTSNSIRAFLDQVRRSQYHDFGTGNWGDKLRFIGAFGENIFAQFGWWLVFAFAGFLALLKSDKKGLAILLALIASNGPVIIALRNLGFGAQAAEIQRPYYLPAYALIALLITVGIAAAAAFAVYLLSRLVAQVAEQPRVFSVSAALLAIVCGSVFAGTLFSANVRADNFSQFHFLDDFSQKMFAGLAPNAVLVYSNNDASEDSMLFSLLYQYAAVRSRPDVQVVGYIDVFRQANPREVNNIYKMTDYRAEQKALLDYAFAQYPGRPAYSSFLYEDPVYGAVSDGYVYREYLKGLASAVPAVTVLPPLQISAKDDAYMRSDVFTASVYKNYLYTKAAAEVARGNVQQSQSDFIDAIGLSDQPGSIQQTEYMDYRDGVLQKHTP